MPWNSRLYYLQFYFINKYKLYYNSDIAENKLN